MDKHSRFRSVFVVIATLIVLSMRVVASERAISAINVATKSEAASKGRSLLVEPYELG